MSKRFVNIFSFLLITSVIVLSGCAQGGGQEKDEKKPIVFADAGWDSLRFHNSVAKIIIENGYDYETKVTTGSSPSTIEGLKKGDIDVYMELWAKQFGDTVSDAIDNGIIKKIGVNFDDNKQGFYVPTFVIEGDKDRGIEPIAPDLKSVKDLTKYPELFKDPESPKKGRIVGAIPGWAADKIMYAKYEYYGLDENFTYFRPGSDAALTTSMAKAVERGKPWVGYYFEPTWIMGLYDFTLLEEANFSEDKWQDGYKCEFPSMDCIIAVTKGFTDRAPEVTKFLKNYKTNSEIISLALAYMQENEAEVDDAAKWYLKNYEDQWTNWVPDDIEEKVKKAIK
ncbi:MAG: ABC transporter substrate-binding protein [Clostridiales bacterium]|nr:ABC transporter substrate-binding protein [Clostridiales bacterium]MCF8021323.1 ABC transporter substrate-binding protein [Clostridiales bacterium]